MNLQSLFFVSQSIFAIFGTLFLIAIIILIIVVIKSISELKIKLSNVMNEGLEAAQETKDVVEKVGKTIIDYIVIRLINKVKKDKKKGDSYGR